MTRTFSISEVAAETGVSLDTLRYYERAGLMLDPVARAGSGHRRYSERDVRWVVFLTKVRKTGMSIRRIRDYAELVRAGHGNEQQRLALLDAHRAEVLAHLLETQRNLHAIEHKIETYRDRISMLENEFADPTARVA